MMGKVEVVDTVLFLVRSGGDGIGGQGRGDD